MSITRVFCDSGNFLTALPGDAFGEIVSHLEKRDVETLMYVSKEVAEKCLRAENGWRSFLSDIYRGVSNPVSVVKDAWIKKRDIEKRAALIDDDHFPRLWPTFTQVHDPLVRIQVYDPLVRATTERIMSLSPWKSRDPENALTPSEIAEWSAIDMLFNEAMERYEADNTWRNATSEIATMTLMVKDYLSQKLVSELGRRIDLVDSFFTLFVTCSKSMPWKGYWNDTQWKELARFVLQNHYAIGERFSEALEQLKTWFGAELPALWMEYGIFGEEGMSHLKDITKDVGKMWKHVLFNEKETNPFSVRYLLAQSILEKLVLVSKHVFQHPEPLVDFILSVLQRVNEERLSDAGMHGTAADEFLMDFEGRLKGMIEDVVKSDDALFCEHSQHEEDGDFIYGRLGPYLFRRLLGIHL